MMLGEHLRTSLHLFNKVFASGRGSAAGYRDGVGRLWGRT